MKINSFIEKTSDFFRNYFSLNGQLVGQADAESAIREGVSFKGTSIVILILAIFIASLGLNTNSTAVIIGAMLISPLMGPIIGIGLGVGVQDFSLIKRCVRNLLMAATFSIIASTLYFLISPVNEQHSELLARTSPTIYDVLIGFVGGGAGIIALGSTNKGNVIPGVAIATALMPPLCTAGYGLATWQLNYFFGASYLFIINSIYIAFATFIGVKLMKYQPHKAADPLRAKKVRKIVYTLAILTMLPSIYLTYNMLRDNKFTMHADEFVKDECRFPDTQVLDRKAFYEHGERYLSITLVGKTLPTDSLSLALTSKLKYYGLEGTKLQIIQGGSMSSTTESGVGDIYRIAQNTITQQQSTIDSLKNDLKNTSRLWDAGQSIAPEIKVLFPQIQQIGVSTTVLGSPSDIAKSDTVNIVLVNTKSALTSPQKDKLTEYLQARLKLKDIKIVSIER